MTKYLVFVMLLLISFTSKGQIKLKVATWNVQDMNLEKLNKNILQLEKFLETNNDPIDILFLQEVVPCNLNGNILVDELKNEFAKLDKYNVSINCYLDKNKTTNLNKGIDNVWKENYHNLSYNGECYVTLVKKNVLQGKSKLLEVLRITRPPQVFLPNDNYNSSQEKIINTLFLNWHAKKGDRFSNDFAFEELIKIIENYKSKKLDPLIAGDFNLVLNNNNHERYNKEYFDDYLKQNYYYVPYNSENSVDNILSPEYFRDHVGGKSTYEQNNKYFSDHAPFKQDLHFGGNISIIQDLTMTNQDNSKSVTLDISKKYLVIGKDLKSSKEKTKVEISICTCKGKDVNFEFKKCEKIKTINLSANNISFSDLLTNNEMDVIKEFIKKYEKDSFAFKIIMPYWEKYIKITMPKIKTEKTNEISEDKSRILQLDEKLANEESKEFRQHTDDGVCKNSGDKIYIHGEDFFDDKDVLLIQRKTGKKINVPRSQIKNGEFKVYFDNADQYDPSYFEIEAYTDNFIQPSAKCYFIVKPCYPDRLINHITIPEATSACQMFAETTRDIKKAENYITVSGDLIDQLSLAPKGGCLEGIENTIKIIASSFIDFVVLEGIGAEEKAILNIDGKLINKGGRLVAEKEYTSFTRVYMPIISEENEALFSVKSDLNATRNKKISVTVKSDHIDLYGDPELIKKFVKSRLIRIAESVKKNTSNFNIHFKDREITLDEINSHKPSNFASWVEIESSPLKKSCFNIQHGTLLAPGHFFYDYKENMMLIYQFDGNLALYEYINEKQIFVEKWSSGTNKNFYYSGIEINDSGLVFKGNKDKAEYLFNKQMYGNNINILLKKDHFIFYTLGPNDEVVTMIDSRAFMKSNTSIPREITLVDFFKNHHLSSIYNSNSKEIQKGDLLDHKMNRGIYKFHMHNGEQLFLDTILLRYENNSLVLYKILNYQHLMKIREYKIDNFIYNRINYSTGGYSTDGLMEKGCYRLEFRLKEDGLSGAGFDLNYTFTEDENNYLSVTFDKNDLRFDFYDWGYPSECSFRLFDYLHKKVSH